MTFGRLGGSGVLPPLSEFRTHAVFQPAHAHTAKLIVWSPSPDLFPAEYRKLMFMQPLKRLGGFGSIFIGRVPGNLKREPGASILAIVLKCETADIIGKPPPTMTA
jgi:hypothetical protein